MERMDGVVLMGSKFASIESFIVVYLDMTRVLLEMDGGDVFFFLYYTLQTLIRDATFYFFCSASVGVGVS